MSAEKHVSKFHLGTDLKDKTYLKKVYTTHPFRMFKPFKWNDTGLKAYQMSSSPGMLEGDQQEFRFEVADNTQLWVVTQSYDKVFTCERGLGADRDMHIQVGKDAYFRYEPQPMIPFKDSILRAKTEIELEDKSSRLAYSEIILAGRVAKKEPEIFDFISYQSLVDIYLGGNLIYRDNMKLDPKKYDLQGIGFFEGQTQLANLLLVNFEETDEIIDYTRELLDANDKLIGGVSEFAENQLIIKIFGNSGQQLMDILEQIINHSESLSNLRK